MKHQDRRPQTSAPQPYAKAVYADLGTGAHCTICSANPCRGHGLIGLVTGMMSAGWLMSGRTLPDGGGRGDDLRIHLGALRGPA